MQRSGQKTNLSKPGHQFLQRNNSIPRSPNHTKYFQPRQKSLLQEPAKSGDDGRDISLRLNEMATPGFTRILKRNTKAIPDPRFKVLNLRIQDVIRERQNVLFQTAVHQFEAVQRKPEVTGLWGDVKSFTGTAEVIGDEVGK